MNTRVSRILRWSLGILAAAFVGIQLVPVERTNPPVESMVPAPAEVETLLRRSCWDCHSNETVWPWYSKVAPASWLVAHDVTEGRDEMNFTAWNRLSSKKAAKAATKCLKEVEKGEMPPWFYTPLHSAARIAPADIEVLRRWAAAPPPFQLRNLSAAPPPASSAAPPATGAQQP
jgi:hypothetical protein